MEVKGQIEEIIYQNESNSYTIAVLSVDEIFNDRKDKIAIDDEVLTVVGYLPFIAERRYA